MEPFLEKREAHRELHFLFDGLQICEVGVHLVGQALKSCTLKNKDHISIIFVIIIIKRNEKKKKKK